MYRYRLAIATALGTVLAACITFGHGLALAQQKLPPKLSTHALDTYTGKQAAGIRIDFFAIDGDKRRLIKSVQADNDGRVPGNLLDEKDMKVGRYELVFHVAEYYRKMGMQQTAPEFLDVVPIRIAIYDAAQRYHVPLYFSPWSFMTYRGS